MPATIFVSSGNLNTEKFYWDFCEDETDKHNKPMTSRIKDFIKSPIIEVEAFICTSPHPNKENGGKDRIEIDKVNLENILNQQIQSFAFPFGEFDEKSIQIIKRVDIYAAVYCKKKRVVSNCDKYRLTRF